MGGGGGLCLGLSPAGFVADAATGVCAEDNRHSMSLKHSQLLLTKNLMPVVTIVKQHLE